ncbi:mast cell protease 8 [Bombina bombina]|uniref:mast cell protease 8 n=1 Tax=Bombina bombina TaxID=8345 RepID=UPI00235A614C|nr:mast cell protease 8 [Bombina bombina]
MASCEALAGLTALLCLIQLGHTGHTESVNSKIIGGHESLPHSKPWMAYITYSNEDGDTLVCGGFLIRKDLVMTAAHCFGRNTRVSLGLHSVGERNEQNTFSVLIYYRHSNYDSNTHESDIMILQIKRPVHLNDAIQIIGLPAKNKRVAVGTTCNVAGWGKIRNDMVSLVLMEVNVTVVNRRKCQEILNISISDSMMCAGTPGTKGDAAEGDSGGPLVCDSIATGIVSFGKEKPPGVYTQISSFLPWIRKIMSG